MKPVLIAADLEAVPDGGEIAVTPETLITPLAREEAARRGITFRMTVSRDREASDGASAAPLRPEKSARDVRTGAEHGCFESMDLRELEHIVHLITDEVLRYFGPPGALPVKPGAACKARSFRVSACRSSLAIVEVKPT